MALNLILDLNMHWLAEMILEALELINDTVKVRNIPVIQIEAAKKLLIAYKQYFFNNGNSSTNVPLTFNNPRETKLSTTP